MDSQATFLADLSSGRLAAPLPNQSTWTVESSFSTLYEYEYDYDDDDDDSPAPTPAPAPAPELPAAHVYASIRPTSLPTRTTSQRTSTSARSWRSTTTSSSTASKRERAKSWLKRIGKGMLESLAFASAADFSPALLEFYQDRRGNPRPEPEVADEDYYPPYFIF